MKRAIYTVIAALMLCGCKGFLSVQPQGYVLPETDEEFASIMHNIIRDVEGGGDEYIVGNLDRLLRLEGCADDLDANLRTGTNLISYAGENINRMQSAYRSHWTIVKDCNIVIENLSGRETETAKGALSAAYAIKGILYYNLIRDYCEPWENPDSQYGLPIVDRFDIEARPARSSLRATCDYAVGLFDKALALDPQDPLFFFTEWIVKAYKAKMLFWMEDWTGTASLCRDIMDNSGFKLTPRGEYEAMINAQNDRKGEVIVRSHINNSSELDWYFSMVKKYLQSRPAASPLVALYGNEPEKDIRYTCSLDGKRFATKTGECKVRLSEILLMRAEAEYHLDHAGEALSLINELRSKRIDGAVDLTEAVLPAVRENNRIKVDAAGNPVTPLLQAIMDERRKELFLEGDRWFELKRCGRPEWWVLSNGLKYTTREYLYTAPIYKNDVDMDPDMKQNPGYGE